MDDLKYWVAFHQVSGIGPKTFMKIEARFGDVETAWNASLADLVAAGVPRKVAGEIERLRDENEPDEVMGKLEDLGITALHLRHPEYPPQLAETPAAPSVIYVKGEMLAAGEQAVAIVGSREATPYGLEMTRRISYDLARAGVTVVSGLARGIDTAGAQGRARSRWSHNSDSWIGTRPRISAAEYSDRRKDHRKRCAIF